MASVLREVKKYGKQKTPTEFRLKCKNGSYVEVETTSSIIYHEGKPIAIQGIAREITFRKENERNLLIKNTDLEFLSNVNKKLNQDLSLSDILDYIINESSELFDSERASIYILSDDNFQLVVICR